MWLWTPNYWNSKHTNQSQSTVGWRLFMLLCIFFLGRMLEPNAWHQCWVVMFNVCVNTVTGRAAYQMLYDTWNTLIIILAIWMMVQTAAPKPVILKLKQHKNCNLRLNMLWIIRDKCCVFLFLSQPRAPLRCVLWIEGVLKWKLEWEMSAHQSGD